jgi:hypothetical protein
MTVSPEVLGQIDEAASYFMELEGQDRTLVVEMMQQMLGDVIAAGQLRPTIEYVNRYCDVIDGPEDAERIAGEIDQGPVS